MKQVFHYPETQQINILDSRYYTNDHKVYYPSVTTILEVYPKGFGFNQWLKDLGQNADAVLERAGAFGSKIHQATEALNDGLEIKWADDKGNAYYTVEEWKTLLKYAEFWRLVSPKLVANEKSLCSPELGYGGTLDRVVDIGGEYWLIDIKTSNYLHKSHELQLSAYAMLWNECFPDEPIVNTAILWLKASTRTQKIDVEGKLFQGVGWQLKTFDRHYTDTFKIFKHTQAIWKEEHPVYRPLNQQYPDTIKL